MNNGGFHWDWAVYLRDNGGGVTYLDWILSAWGWTAAVAAGALLLALVFGLTIGVVRTLPQRSWVWLGNAWVELFRNIPLLVQIFLWYHVLPELLPPLKHLSGFVLVVVALGLFTSARIAEQVRAGIQALPRGQAQAALALGLTLGQSYRYVLLPLALRIVIPAITSEAMNIVKNSSVAFAVSVAELTMFAMQALEETARGIEIYLGVTGLYFVTAFAINRLARVLERRLQLPGMLKAAR